jgi:hypothetical protein
MAGLFNQLFSLPPCDMIGIDLDPEGERGENSIKQGGIHDRVV